MKPFVAVQRDQRFKEDFGPGSLGFLAPEFTGVAGVQGDPLQDEAHVRIRAFLLGSDEPTQRPVDAQPQGLWFTVADLAVAVFQLGGGEHRGGSPAMRGVCPFNGVSGRLCLHHQRHVALLVAG